MLVAEIVFPHVTPYSFQTAEATLDLDSVHSPGIAYYMGGYLCLRRKNMPGPFRVIAYNLELAVHCQWHAACPQCLHTRNY